MLRFDALGGTGCKAEKQGTEERLGCQLKATNDPDPTAFCALVA
jgi:hypothetical protein